MRVYDQGSCIRVTVSAFEVEDFAARWPCFGPRVPLSFTFERNGDLVDVRGQREGEHDDAGILALLADAWDYAVKRLKLDNDDDDVKKHFEVIRVTF